MLCGLCLLNLNKHDIKHVKTSKLHLHSHNRSRKRSVSVAVMHCSRPNASHSTLQPLGFRVRV